MNIRYACPNCRARLDSGLRCPDCGFLGVWRDGLLFLHRNDASWDRCIIERNGWISRTKEVGLYRENDDHFFLPDQRPHLKQVYAESKAHIDTFMRAEDLNGRICVDLGASIGWVEAYVLKTYPLADLIALEINDDRFCGLGRSLVLKEQLGIEFTSLVADMHHIPLCDESVSY